MRIVGALVALLLVGFAGYLFFAPARVQDGTSPGSPPPAAGDPNRPMTDEERQAYIREFVRVADLRLGPDLDPDGNEVPGLQRITGKVHNQGEQPIDKVIVVVYPKDEQGNVLGAEQQDVVDRVLKPGQVEEFDFQVRARKAFAGQFDHELQ